MKLQYGHRRSQKGTCMYSMYFCPGLADGIMVSLVGLRARCCLVMVWIRRDSMRSESM